MNQSPIHQAVARIRDKAKELRAFGAEEQARALAWAAAQVEGALKLEASEYVTPERAAVLSGYSLDRIYELVKEGRVASVRSNGAKGRILILKSTLPKKPGRRQVPPADVHELASRLLERGKEGHHGHP